MKIDGFSISQTNNDEHFQFHTECKDLVNEFDPAVLKIKPQFDAYLKNYAKVDEALRKIFKSYITEEIQVADSKRDLTFRGMADTNKAALNYFKPDVVEAAKRIKIVLDTYGNVGRKPLNEETSAIYNLLQELNGKYSKDVKTVGLQEWVSELEKNNSDFDRLVKSRYEETADRTDLVLRDVRKQLDIDYHTIIERINALMIVEGGDVLENFTRRLNVVIGKYANTIAQRLGKSKSKNRQQKTGSVADPAAPDDDPADLDGDINRGKQESL
jgi:hypothetical protein